MCKTLQMIVDILKTEVRMKTADLVCVRIMAPPTEYQSVDVCVCVLTLL